jgi:predicted ATP-dependent serine protease
MAAATSETWRCYECGALYVRHLGMCMSCWKAGCVIPMAHRLRAAIDSVPGVSNARALAGMAWRKIEQPAYPNLELGWGALVLTEGPSGSGKSTFTCCLGNAVKGAALLVAAEEGLSPTLAARLQRCAVKRDDFHVLTRASVDAAVAFATEKRIVTCILDSIQEATWTSRELRHVLEVVPTLGLLIAVAQVTKEGVMAGSNRYRHEADVVIRVESLAWNLTKSRYQDTAGVGGPVLRSEEVV